jgi:hypothetical protein
VDVVSAYLNAELDETIYMQAPPGVLSPEDKDKVCRLLKGLYGVKQAGRAWQKRLTRAL